MIIISQDLATKTGWAVWQNGNIIASGVQDFSKRRGESNGIMFLRYRKWLMDLARGCTEPPAVIAYERAHYRGGAATEICVGLQTHCQSIAAELAAHSLPVHTSVLKKWAAGSGTAKKPMMIEAARRLSGIEPEDDNHADAILIALFAVSDLMPEVHNA